MPYRIAGGLLLIGHFKHCQISLALVVGLKHLGIGLAFVFHNQYLRHLSPLSLVCGLATPARVTVLGPEGIQKKHPHQP